MAVGWWIGIGVCAVFYYVSILKDIDLEDTAIIILVFSIPASISGAILAGKLFSSVWWVGLLIGLLAGFILALALENFGKPLVVLLPLFVSAGAILAHEYFGGLLWSVLGALTGGVVCYLLNLPFIIKEKARFDEWRRQNEGKRTEEENHSLTSRLKERAELEGIRLEEYERNRPIEEILAEQEKKAEETRRIAQREEERRAAEEKWRVAELENRALTVYQKNLSELQEAEKNYAQEFAVHECSPQDLLEIYKDNQDVENIFDSSLWDAVSNSGVDEARKRVEELNGIAMLFASAYRVSSAKAKLESRATAFTHEIVRKSENPD